MNRPLDGWISLIWLDRMCLMWTDRQTDKHRRRRWKEGKGSRHQTACFGMDGWWTLCILARCAVLKPWRITSDGTSAGAREEKNKTQQHTSCASQPAPTHSLQSKISTDYTEHKHFRNDRDVSYFSVHCILKGKWSRQCHDRIRVLKAATLAALCTVHVHRAKQPSALLVVL